MRWVTSRSASSAFSGGIPLPVSLTRSSTCRPRADTGVAAVVDVAVGGGDAQRAALGHGVAGVDGQVDQHLLQLARVGEHRPQLRAQVDVQPDVLAEGAQQQLLDLADDGVEVQHPRLHDLAPAEREQLVGQFGGPLAGPQDLGDVLAGLRPLAGGVVLGGLGDLLGQERRVVEHDGEQVVEVVRHPAGELAEALQAL